MPGRLTQRDFYDVQYAGRETRDDRVIPTSDDDGMIYFKGIVPAPYPIPHDGPVGKPLAVLNPYRPSHLHFMFKEENFVRLVT
jgi:protocatechuate 3,4-dioxygenase beta subunit